MQFKSIALVASICASMLIAVPGASAAAMNGSAIGAAAAATSLIDQVQRCRCVERRWNGSCKLRVCHDRRGSVDSAEPDTIAPGQESEDDDRSIKPTDQPSKAKKARRKPMQP